MFNNIYTNYAIINYAKIPYKVVKITFINIEKNTNICIVINYKDLNIIGQ